MTAGRSLPSRGAAAPMAIPRARSTPPARRRPPSCSSRRRRPPRRPGRDRGTQHPEADPFRRGRQHLRAIGAPATTTTGHGPPRSIASTSSACAVSAKATRMSTRRRMAHAHRLIEEGVRLLSCEPRHAAARSSASSLSWKRDRWLRASSRHAWSVRYPTPQRHDAGPSSLVSSHQPIRTLEEGVSMNRGYVVLPRCQARARSVMPQCSG